MANSNLVVDALFKGCHTLKVFHLSSSSVLVVLNSIDTNTNSLLVTSGHSVVFRFLAARDPPLLFYCSFVSFKNTDTGP